MGQAFVSMLRQALEPALVLAVVLAHCARIERRDLRSGAWTGAGIALLAGVLVAFGIAVAQLDERMALGLLAAVAAVALIVVAGWTGRSSRAVSAAAPKARKPARGAWALGALVGLVVLRSATASGLALARPAAASSVALLAGAGLALAVVVVAAVGLSRVLRLGDARIALAVSLALLLVAAIGSGAASLQLLGPAAPGT